MMFRLAVPQDVPKLKEMYRRIMAYLDEVDMQIWDEYYPCELLDGDVEKQQLYIMTQGEAPVAAFALCRTSGGEGHVVWSEPDASALYLERLGVDTVHMRNGVASQMLQKAMEITREQGKEYLRLFAAADNPPSLALYRKNGFQQAEGVFEEVINENWTISEYGFEIRVKEP